MSWWSEGMGRSLETEAEEGPTGKACVCEEGALPEQVEKKGEC
jgi:hypothetical protein